MDNDSAADTPPAHPFHRPSRRSVLAAGAAGAGAVALAACTGSGSATSPLARTSSSGADSSPASAGGTVLAKLDDIPVGSAVAAELGGKPVVVCRPEASSAVCFSAICTHMGCTVKPAGKEYHCPCHGSVYDASTGAVLHGPAPRALARIDVHVAGGDVVTG